MRETLQLSWHVVVRNWRVYAKDFLANISPTAVDPALLLLALGMGLSPYMKEVEGHPYTAFLAPGLACTTAMFTAFFEASYGFYVKMTYEAIFKAMLTTPIGVDEVLLGELWWVGIKGAMMATGVSLVLACFGLFTYLPWIFAMPFIGAAVGLACGSIGLIASTLVKNIDQFQLAYAFVVSPLYFFSGVFFPVNAAPKWFQIMVNISPLYQGARLSQMAYWNDFHPGEAAVRTVVLLVYAGVLSLIAARRVRKRLIL
jgi:lipooligosaccharide transport system permease protein